MISTTDGKIKAQGNQRGPMVALWRPRRRGRGELALIGLVAKAGLSRD
jgi:hypothetical protein